MRTEEPVVATPEDAKPNTQSWRDSVQPWWKATLSILPTFLLTRFLFLLLAYFGGVLFAAANFSATSVSYHDLLADWNRGDVTSYISIATNGYTKPEQTLFFPLYPALLRALAPLFRHSILTAGFFLTNLAFLSILIVLYRLVEIEFDRDTAKRTTLYMAIFPTAFIFFVAYSDSLFLLFALLSFYTMRRGSWWLAGLFGALATLTQLAGIFLLGVFLCEFARQRRPQLQQAWREHALIERVRPATHALAGLLIPLALVLYCVALLATFNDPFVFIHAQTQQNTGFLAPFLALKAIVSQPHFSVGVAHAILALAAFVLFLTLMVLCFFGPERLAKSQWTFAVFGLLLLFSALVFSGSAVADNVSYEPLASMPRLVVSIFPGFIMLARSGRRAWLHQGYLLLALPTLAFFVLQFITGLWTI